MTEGLVEMRVKRETRRSPHATKQNDAISDAPQKPNKQKTRRSGFFSDHPNILSAAVMAMVDRP
jgi:hypothetical protein